MPWRDKIIFYPVHLTLSTVISLKKEEYERRYYSNYHDSYLGSGLWQQFEQMASARQASSIASIVQANASRAKFALFTQEMGRKSRFAGEQRIKNVWRKQKFEKSWTLTLNLIKYFEKYRCHSIYESEKHFRSNKLVWCDHCQMAKFVPRFFLAKNWKYLNSL